MLNNNNNNNTTQAIIEFIILQPSSNKQHLEIKLEVPPIQTNCSLNMHDLIYFIIPVQMLSSTNKLNDIIYIWSNEPCRTKSWQQ
jgi:hypothetical protein